MLTDKLTPADATSTDDADFFADALFTIFADAQNQHGDPGQSVIYANDAHGKILLRLADPDPADNSLFSHFLWNAGVQAAELITSTPREFDVRGRRVLELGAGAGLPGIVSALDGAREVVLSDYPAEKILENLKHNVDVNLRDRPCRDRVRVLGHKWGETTDEVFAGYAEKRFQRIVAADCMWMAWQHENLCGSIARLLEPREGVCLAIAGFHTGREKVRGFFEAVRAAGMRVGGLHERDVMGVRREWVEDRGKEDPIERKRWLTIAYLTLPEYEGEEFWEEK